MRICTDKSGKLIEMQSDAVAGTLIQNAVNAGYKASDVSEQVITMDQWIALYNNLPNVIAANAAVAQRNQDVIDNLPTWQQVSDAIDAATTIAQMKVIVKKMARVVYWLAKNSQG